MRMLDPKEVFLERELLFVRQLRQQLTYRNATSSYHYVRQQIREHVLAIRSIRAARLAYSIGLKHIIRKGH